MNDLDRWLDEEEPPYDERAFLDGAYDVPDLTPEQKERLWRKLGPRIEAMDRRLARERRAKQALRWGLAAACGLTAMALVVRLVGAEPQRSATPRGRFADEGYDVEIVQRALPRAPALPVSATAQPGGAGAVRRPGGQIGPERR